MAQRPLGVTIIAGLGLLKNILLFLLGLAILVGGSLLGLLGGLGIVFGALAGIIGVVVLIFGLVGIVIYWMLWNMKKLGMWIVIILEVLSLLASLAGLVAGSLASIIGVAWSGIVIWYLWKNQKIFK